VRELAAAQHERLGGPGMIQADNPEDGTPGKPCLVPVKVLAPKSPGYSVCLVVTVCPHFGGGLYAYARLYYMCGAKSVQVALVRSVLQRGFCIRFPG
jgi:hypothetical protein